MPAEAVDVRTGLHPWKPVVVAIPIKKGERAKRPLLIMTQTRIIQNMAYDPNSHMTQEAVGETIKNGELPGTAVQRGIAEECGDKNVSVIIHGNSTHTYTTGKLLFGGIQDAVRCYNPYRLVVIETHPQPWFAAVFLVEVPNDWEPNLNEADGEAGKATWWTPWALKEALDTRPENFHILHYGAYCQLVDDILEGRLPEFTIF